MTEAVERIVPLRFSYVRAELLSGHPPVDRVRVDGKLAGGDEHTKWIAASSTWLESQDAGATVRSCDTPLGELRAVRLKLGYGSDRGNIWFGSSDADFPTTTQLAFLRAAASLAATGLQTARVNHEREETSRFKDEFLAMLGHELRNPLAPIVSALDLIKLKSVNLPPEYMVIDRQVKHLRRLVDDLLDVSRITQGKIALRKEELDIKFVLSRAIEAVNPLLEERRHVLSMNFANDRAKVSGDLVRLTQVFVNLLTNAAKYTGPQGTISITTSVGKDHVSVAITDNGSGFSADLYPRLFTIFEQGGTTIERSNGGLGIGLALVKSFVESHGGTVTAASNGVGRGSEFTVILPLLDQSVERRPPKVPERESTSRSSRILIVDDNLDALEIMGELLRNCGYEVAVASDPLEALMIAPEFLPTVAILDIGLPVMDGYQLGKELRKQFSLQNLRLIALTGYGQAGDRERSAAAGFNDHLTKPVNVDDLISALAAGAGGGSLVQAT